MRIDMLKLEGFKSFGAATTVSFGDITIFIGANASGKSNLLSFFELLHHIAEERLGYYVEKQGKAYSLLTSRDMQGFVESELHFSSAQLDLKYNFRLEADVLDGLFFSMEKFNAKKSGKQDDTELKLKPNRPESEMVRRDYDAFPVVQLVRHAVSGIKSFHFQNTAQGSPLRKSVHMNVFPFLTTEGENLGAFLYYLSKSQSNHWYYKRIESYVQMAYPGFDGFWFPDNLNEHDYITLRFRDKSQPPSSHFGVHQLSDGTLRFIALAALLLAPPDTLPAVIVIDEPELGLHPAAIALLAEMIHVAAENAQVIIATQSSHLLDEFEPDQIRVVERDPNHQYSVVHQPKGADMQAWLNEYSLGELWEKNFMGGRP